MEKIAAGEEARGVLDLDAPIAENLKRLGRAKKTSVDDLTVLVLDRPRHDGIVDQVREAGARIRFIPDGDVEGAIAAAREGSGVDLYVGTGGTPEGVIAACAMKCLGGELQGRLSPRSDEERDAAVQGGYDVDSILTADDLVAGNDVFFAATGITDGDLLRGIRYRGESAVTTSIVMRSRSGTVRLMDAYHRLERLAQYSQIDY